MAYAMPERFQEMISRGLEVHPHGAGDDLEIFLNNFEYPDMEFHAMPVMGNA